MTKFATLYQTSRINAMTVHRVDATQDWLMTGGEDGSVRAWKLNAVVSAATEHDRPPDVEWSAHECRIKGLDATRMLDHANTRQTVLTTIDSSGRVRLWSLTEILAASFQDDAKPKVLGEWHAHCRLNCVLMTVTTMGSNSRDEVNESPKDGADEAAPHSVETSIKVVGKKRKRK